ncbi:MAG: TetR/AcrR family transcriptional regulator [Novosphingobium sp.]|nr:TetR/AcrR family transcriptional regulator [Novosphingobium sp.]
MGLLTRHAIAPVHPKTSLSIMPSAISQPPQRRNKAFEETHGLLIDTAVRLISEKGIEALSLVELAREAGVNRTTVYYHFSDREALIREVRAWSAAQLARAFSIEASPRERADYISRFVLENPELIKLWIDDFLAPGDIRERYPEWDNLVAGVAARFERERPGLEIDAEVYCVNMLTVAMIGPRVYRNSVRPELDLETAMARFNREQMRMLGHDGMDGLPD